MDEAEVAPLNRPSPEGRAAGVQLGRLTDKAIAEATVTFPGLTDERCKSCAYRGGSIPNGCAETVMDAIACAVTREPFWCHLRFHADGSPMDLCAGWAALQSSSVAERLRSDPRGQQAIEDWDVRRPVLP